MTDLTSFQVTDLVTDVLADYYNKILGSILRSEFNNTETITATKELADVDCPYQIITASGANRTVELPPEATTNHPFFIYNASASNSVVVKDDSGATTYATLAADEWGLFMQVQGEGWIKVVPRAETPASYKLSVTVSSNDLVVALKHADGTTDPSATNPLYFVINGVARAVTGATSITIADGTNWFNSGSAELGTLLVPYFVYVVWDSNSSVVALSIARYAHGRLVSDFSATTTNEGHLFNYANFTSTDDVENIGSFEATLSLSGTSHLWTVPTFTNANLKHEPTFASNWMTWTPTLTGFSANPSSTIYQYRVEGKEIQIRVRQAGDGTSNATTFSLTAPFTAQTLTNGSWQTSSLVVIDNGAATTTPGLVSIGSASNSINLRPNTNGSATWTAANGKRVGFFEMRFPLAA